MSESNYIIPELFVYTVDLLVLRQVSTMFILLHLVPQSWWRSLQEYQWEQIFEPWFNFLYHQIHCLISFHTLMFMIFSHKDYYIISYNNDLLTVHNEWRREIELYFSILSPSLSHALSPPLCLCICMHLSVSVCTFVYQQVRDIRQVLSECESEGTALATSVR